MADNHEERIEAEVKQLVVDINRLSPGNDGGVPFGVLFDDDDVAQYYEALIGTLKAAKKRNIVDFKGQMLLKGAHDNVIISILGARGDPAPQATVDDKEVFMPVPPMPEAPVAITPSSSSDVETVSLKLDMNLNDTVTPKLENAPLPYNTKTTTATPTSPTPSPAPALTTPPPTPPTVSGISTFPLDQLLNTPTSLPASVDVTRKEQYLSEADFEKAFGITKDAFEKLPKWKQQAAKKKAGLF